MVSSSDNADPFDDVLNLEERFYAEGYEQGTRDGDRAGKIEGRSVGLAKGYDKFLESGRLYGKALVWGNRLQEDRQSKADKPDKAEPETSAAVAATTTDATAKEEAHEARSQGRGQAQASTFSSCSLPPLPSGNARLSKNVVALHALVEPETLSMDNSDEAVNDFDDRVKRAQGRVKVVERMLGE